MHPFFEPLSERDAMLLITTLTVGGRDELKLLDYLPDERRSALQEKAQALLNVEREKRVSFMVNQLQEALRTKSSKGIERIDPSWLSFELQNESPRVVGSVLINLPSKTIKSVVRRLPAEIRGAMPPKRQMSKIKPEILETVQQIFESRFFPMPNRGVLKEFTFQDLIRFDRTELAIIMRKAGLAELGQAFVSVGKMALIDLCRQLATEQSEELILAVKKATIGDPMELKSAQRFLSRVATDFTSHDDFFHKAGLWRMAKSCLAEPPAFAMAFSQRLPREPGLLFRNMIDIATQMEDITEPLVLGFQDALLSEIPELLVQGKLDPKWADHPIRFHNPDRFQTAAEPNFGSNEPEVDNPDENEA
jgi:hypothetical protein